MAWERRSNGHYYYRKRRIGDRVVSEYIGTGEFAEAIATLDKLDRERREMERERWRREREAILEADAQVDAACNLVRALTHATPLTEGYHTHKRQWRKKRNG